MLLPVNASSAGNPVFPTGLRIGLAPPEGFVVSKTFPGFESAEHRATIVLAELPGVAFETLEHEINAELQKNPDLASQREELKFGAEGSGFIVTGRQETSAGPFLKWTAVAKFDLLTAVATVLVPEQAKDAITASAIREALATMTVRARVSTDEQLAALPFELTDLAGFRLVRVQPGSAAMLTEGPADQIESVRQPLLLISAAQGQMPQPDDRDTFARRLFGSIPGLTNQRIMRSEGLRMGNHFGHELLVDAKDAKTGVDVTAVQWLRFGGGGLIRFIAVTRKDAWASLYPRLRTVRDGIEPR